MKKSDAAGEFALIDWIRRREPTRQSVFTRSGIGDDCAILQTSAGSELLVTTDMLMDGRHFVFERDGPESVGYKAMGVNLSDIAAMAGIPRAAVIAVALPLSAARAVSQGLHEGIRRLAERFSVDLVGGDTNAWDGPLVISITLLGETTSRGAVRRGGARPGDVILVTGALGGSLASGRHLRPEPRISEALALHEAVSLHALIDISDGLSSDLGHILAESGGLGAVLNEDAIPIHPDARAMSLRDGITPLDHALNDGEDFELCLVVAAEDAARLTVAPPVSLYQVGRVTESPGLQLCVSGGQVMPISPRGYDHVRARQ